MINIIIIIAKKLRLSIKIAVEKDRFNQFNLIYWAEFEQNNM